MASSSHQSKSERVCTSRRPSRFSAEHVLGPRFKRPLKEGCVVQRPPGFNAFEFVVLSGLRAAQLMRGCTPRVESNHKVITTAQMEVAEWKVVRALPVAVAPEAKAALGEKEEAVGLLT